MQSVAEARHLHSLDIARGLAALAVVLYHWHAFFLVGAEYRAGFSLHKEPAYALLHGFYHYGYAAVSLFFSLSGFVFFWLFASRIAASSLGLREFFVHRISRLYPLHLATLLIVAALQAIYSAQQGVAFGFASNDLRHFVLNLIMFPSAGLSFNGPSWSVSVEMILYAVFFLYCAVARPRFVTMLIVALVGFLILGRNGPVLGSSVGSFFLGGCMSVAYGFLSRGPGSSTASWAVIVSVFALWCVVGLMPWSDLAVTRLVSPPGGAPDLLTVLLFPLTILALALLEAELPEVFEAVARLTRLGPLSYSIYMIHFPLQLLVVILATVSGVDFAGFYSPVALVAFLVLLFATGLLSHYRFELPLQRFIRAAVATRSTP